MFALSSNSTQLNPNQLKLIVFVLRVRVVAEALARAYRRAPMSRRMVHSGDQLYIIHLAVASSSQLRLPPLALLFGRKVFALNCHEDVPETVEEADRFQEVVTI